MMDQGFDITGVDGSESMVEQAVFHHPELAGRIRQSELPDGLPGNLGLFDGVYAIAVLMHLSRKDIEISISRINSLLIPKGKFMFSVPTRRDDMERDEFDEKGRRFTAFSQDDWKALCTRNNFYIVRTMISKDGLGRGGVEWMNCLTEKKI